MYQTNGNNLQACKRRSERLYYELVLIHQTKMRGLIWHRQ